MIWPPDFCLGKEFSLFSPSGLISCCSFLNHNCTALFILRPNTAKYSQASAPHNYIEIKKKKKRKEKECCCLITSSARTHSWYEVDKMTTLFSLMIQHQFSLNTAKLSLDINSTWGKLYSLTCYTISSAQTQLTMAKKKSEHFVLLLTA